MGIGTSQGKRLARSCYICTSTDVKTAEEQWGAHLAYINADNGIDFLSYSLLATATSAAVKAPAYHKSWGTLGVVVSQLRYYKPVATSSI